MKLSTSMKALVAAVGLALAGTASAATIVNDGTTGNGDMMFTAWDGNNGYIYDLGIRMDDIISSPNTSHTWTLPSFSLGSGTIWGVAGGDFAGNGLYAGYRVLISDTATTLSLKDNATKNAAQYWNSFFINQNVTPGPDGCGGSNPCTVPALLTGTTNPNNSYPGNPNFYGSAIKGSLPTSITADLGTTMALWLSDTTSSGSFSGNAAMTKLPGTLSVNGNTLTYSAVSAVPLPAAVWLMGSALMGLVGIGRRRSA